MRIILLSLTSLIILLVPQLAFASMDSEDDEGTVTWFKGKMNGIIAESTISPGQDTYIQVDTNTIDGDPLHVNVDGTIRVIDPNDDERLYSFTTRDGTAYVDINTGPDAPTGHYSFEITADGYESFWGEFEVE